LSLSASQAEQTYRCNDDQDVVVDHRDATLNES